MSLNFVKHIDKKRFLTSANTVQGLSRQGLSGMNGLGANIGTMRSSAPHYSVLTQKSKEIAQLRWEIVSGKLLDPNRSHYNEKTGKFTGRIKMQHDDKGKDISTCPAYFFTDKWGSLYILGRSKYEKYERYSSNLPATGGLDLLIEQKIAQGTTESNYTEISENSRDKGSGWRETEAWDNGEFIEIAIDEIKKRESESTGKNLTPYIVVLNEAEIWDLKNIWTKLRSSFFAISASIVSNLSGGMISKEQMLNWGANIDKLVNGKMSNEDLVMLGLGASTVALTKTDLLDTKNLSKYKELAQNTSALGGQLVEAYQSKDFSKIGNIGLDYLNTNGVPFKMPTDKIAKIMNLLEEKNYNEIVDELGIDGKTADTLIYGLKNQDMFMTMARNPQKFLNKAQTMATPLAMEEVNTFLNGLFSSNGLDAMKLLPNKLAMVKGIATNTELSAQEHSALMNFAQGNIEKFIPDDLINLFVDSEVAFTKLKNKAYQAGSNLDPELQNILNNEINNRIS